MKTGETANGQKTTVDALLGGRFFLEQPAVGYRVAVDTLLVAAAVPARAQERVLDLGCGAGGVMLALSARVPGVRVSGIEIQHDFAVLCERNIRRNEKCETLDVLEGAVEKLPEHWKGAFDGVVMNPPFHDALRHDASPRCATQKAKMDKGGEIDIWLGSACYALKEGGSVTMICRADRQEEMIQKANVFFGKLLVKPIQTKQDGTCKRFVLRGLKGGEKSVTLCAPFVSYALSADDVLRHAQELLF